MPQRLSNWSKTSRQRRERTHARTRISQHGFAESECDASIPPVIQTALACGGRLIRRDLHKRFVEIKNTCDGFFRNTALNPSARWLSRGTLGPARHPPARGFIRKEKTEELMEEFFSKKKNKKKPTCFSNRIFCILAGFALLLMFKCNMLRYNRSSLTRHHSDNRENSPSLRPGSLVICNVLKVEDIHSL